MYGSRRRKKSYSVKESLDFSTDIQSDTLSESRSSKKASRKSSGGCGCGKRSKRIKEE